MVVFMTQDVAGEFPIHLFPASFPISLPVAVFCSFLYVSYSVTLLCRIFSFLSNVTTGKLDLSNLLQRLSPVL